MSAWIAIVVGGIATYLMRASFVAFPSRELPPSFERSLRYVGPSAFAAIVLPAVLGADGLNSFGSPDARILAAVVAGIFFWRTKHLLGGLVLGMVAFWLLRWAGA